MTMRLIIFCLVIAASCLRGTAQNYSVSWYKVSGGGGTSTNGSYQISGTIGQPDASGAMSGGNYSVTGGFWSFVQVVQSQSAGAPTLYLSHSGNVVTIYWQNVSGWSLIQSSSLTTPLGSWSASSSPTLSSGTNYLNITNPTGNVFFSLTHP